MILTNESTAVRTLEIPKSSGYRLTAPTSVQSLLLPWVSAVPPGAVAFPVVYVEKKSALGRTRTCALLIRSQVTQVPVVPQGPHEPPLKADSCSCVARSTRTEPREPSRISGQISGQLHFSFTGATVAEVITPV